MQNYQTQALISGLYFAFLQATVSHKIYFGTARLIILYPCVQTSVALSLPLLVVAPMIMISDVYILHFRISHRIYIFRYDLNCKKPIIIIL